MISTFTFKVDFLTLVTVDIALKSDMKKEEISMQHPKMKWTYAGVDSHRDSHTIVFLDCFHDKLGELSVSNTTSGFQAFFKKAQKFCLPNTTIAWGFEDTSMYGRMFVKFLLGKKQLVKHVNANLVASERNSSNALHKTDSIDAECAAKVLINRFDKLPVASSQDRYWILSSLVKRRESIIKMNTMLKNQLHSLIAENYPSYRKFFFHLDGKGSLAFYEQYPSPARLADITIGELTMFLKHHSNGSFKEDKAKLILDTIQTDGTFIIEHQDMRDFIIQSTIKQFKSNRTEIMTIDEKLTEVLDYFDYPLTSIKGIDTITATKFIKEIGDINRFPNAGALARFAGIAPATYASGTNNVQFANARGNRTLNKLFFHLAIKSAMLLGGPRHMNGERMKLNSFFYDYYAKKISEGKTKKQSLKCVQRRLVNIVFRVMKHNVPYVNPPVEKVSAEALEDKKS